jgi:hypothetical protein
MFVTAKAFAADAFETLCRVFQWQHLKKYASRNDSSLMMEEISEVE